MIKIDDDNQRFSILNRLYNYDGKDFDITSDDNDYKSSNKRLL